ncbi:MAG: hypothetical protein GY778_23180 [bacterium]|nr:hypothetical protein [bacterium]
MLALMAIQFPCPSCRQPIEIDDEWASKPVSCPYCQKMVTAPESSTLSPEAGPAWAAPGSPPVATGMAGLATTPVEAAMANPIARVALILACAALGALIAGKILLRLHPDEVAELTELVESTNDMAEMQRATLDYIDAQGGYPAWMKIFTLLFLASMLLWLAALICGLIGRRRPEHRAQTMATLVIVGVFPILMCCVG